MRTEQVIRWIEKFSEKNRLILISVCLSLMLAMIFIYIAFIFNPEVLNNPSQSPDCLLSLMGMIFTFALFFCIAIGDFSADKNNLTFSSAVVLLHTVFCFSGLAYASCCNPDYQKASIALTVIYYITETFMLFLMLLYIILNLPRRNKDSLVILGFTIAAAVYIFLVLLNIRFGFMFRISNGYIEYNKNDIVTTAASFIWFSFLTYYVLTAKCNIRKKLSLCSITVLFMLGIIFNFLLIIKKINTSFDLSGMFHLVALYVVFFSIFAQQKNELNVQKAENAELKTAIMISQIQPHFLYNSLTAIRRLCLQDPKLAAKAIEYFSAYLRMNMNSLQDNNKMISFDDELEHIKTYLWIEKLRFGDELNIEYDIQCTDFMLPPLSVQPLVENAVKYGVCQREDGGTVKITTRRKKNGSVVVAVYDDGPGFEPDKINNDNKTHIGIANIKKRLKMLSCGKLYINSKLGEYTLAKLVLKQGYIE